MNRRTVETYLDQNGRVVPKGDPSAKLIRRQVYDDAGNIIEASVIHIKRP